MMNNPLSGQDSTGNTINIETPLFICQCLKVPNVSIYTPANYEDKLCLPMWLQADSTLTAEGTVGFCWAQDSGLAQVDPSTASIQKKKKKNSYHLLHGHEKYLRIHEWQARIYSPNFPRLLRRQTLSLI